jgi:hypothetical protein
VYAFDADNPASPPLWQTSFIHPPDVTSVPSSGYVCNEVQPEIGIISTPVIDLASGTLYVVAMTKEAGTYFFRLHALSVNTGVEVGTGHVVIQASAPGTGDGNDGQGQVPFSTSNARHCPSAWHGICCVCLELRYPALSRLVVWLRRTQFGSRRHVQ